MPTETLSRFVILRHALPPDDARGVHWDFMLELGPALRTWALAAEPQDAQSIAAQPLADHRLEYLDYEGPISRNRGEVSRWDDGQFWLEHDEPGKLMVQLRGTRLHGRVTLTEDRSADQRWTFSFVAEPTSI